MTEVFVYKNSRRKSWTGTLYIPVYSIKSWKTKRVYDWQPAVSIHNATFKVSEAGRLRVLRENRKNVHAGVLGERMHPLRSQLEKDFGPGRRISYNPYKNDSFVDSQGRPIVSAEYVCLTHEGVFAYGKQCFK